MAESPNQTKLSQVLSAFAVLAVLGLMVGFMFNRVVFNIGVFFASLYVILHKDWYKRLFNDPYLLSFALLPIVVLVADLAHNRDVILQTTFFNKLILIAIPLFIYLWQPTRLAIKNTHRLLYGFLLINTLYSLSHYFSNQEAVVEGYKFAKVMEVLSFGDHIRLSWLTALSIVLAIWDYVSNPGGKWRWVYLAYGAFQAVYLHLLSAKTGLLCLYMSLIILVFYYFWSRRKKFQAFLVGLAVLVLPVLAYLFIPPFQTRMDYIRWDVFTAIRGVEQPGLSDGARIYSIQAGWQQFTDHPVWGNGFITIKEHTDAWYAVHKSFIIEAQKILPSSEWLIFAIGAGILGVLVLSWHFIQPFLKKTLWQRAYFPAIYLPALVTFLYETHFEGQTTLFVYAFWVFWAYQLFVRTDLK